MNPLSLSVEEEEELVSVLLIHLQTIEHIYFLLLFIISVALSRRPNNRTTGWARHSLARHRLRSLNLHWIAFANDLQCVENCRMDRRAFYKLCGLLATHGQLKETRNMTIEEMVATFLYIIGHDEKYRVIKRQLMRSKETISRQFHAVLNSVLRLQGMLLEKPKPVPENSTDEKWKWFKV